EAVHRHVYMGRHQRGQAGGLNRAEARRHQRDRLFGGLVGHGPSPDGRRDFDRDRAGLCRDPDLAVLSPREPMRIALSRPELKAFGARLREGSRSQRGSVLSAVLIMVAFLGILSGALMTELSTNLLLSTDMVNRVAVEA